METIKTIRAREILDSRGNPTIEVDVILSGGGFGRAAVPSGASTGTKEAVELRDGDLRRYHGKGVKKAVANVTDIFSKALTGTSIEDLRGIDNKLIELDGTPHKSKYGANAILGVSLACLRAFASASHRQAFEVIGDSVTLPVPCFNIVNGGAHADNSVDFQEFMIVPVGASSFSEALRMGSEVYWDLKSILKTHGYSTAVGDEGGFAPNLRSNVEAMDLILEAIAKSGYQAGKDIGIALDPASSEFFVHGKYSFKKSDKSLRTSEQMVEYYEAWVNQYPILSIEDGLSEDDWSGWKYMTERLGSRIQLVGDDIFVTNPQILKKGIEEKVGNAILIKVNQIGTLTETLETMKEAKRYGYGTMVSHRSGETGDDFIAHLAVGAGALQIKSGAPCRGERLSKYNELLRIEEMIGEKAQFPGHRAFQRSL